MFYDVLYVFHDVLLCLRIVYDVQRVAQRSATADRLRDRDNAAGIGYNSAGISDNSAEIGDDAAGIIDIAANVIPC